MNTTMNTYMETYIETGFKVFLFDVISTLDDLTGSKHIIRSSKSSSYVLSYEDDFDYITIARNVNKKGRSESFVYLCFFTKYGIYHYNCRNNVYDKDFGDLIIPCNPFISQVFNIIKKNYTNDRSSSMEYFKKILEGQVPVVVKLMWTCYCYIKSHTVSCFYNFYTRLNFKEMTLGFSKKLGFDTFECNPGIMDSFDVHFSKRNKTKHSYKLYICISNYAYAIYSKNDISKSVEFPDMKNKLSKLYKCIISSKGFCHNVLNEYTIHRDLVRNFYYKDADYKTLQIAMLSKSKLFNFDVLGVIDSYL